MEETIGGSEMSEDVAELERRIEVLRDAVTTFTRSQNYVPCPETRGSEDVIYVSWVEKRGQSYAKQVLLTYTEKPDVN